MCEGSYLSAPKIIESLQKKLLGHKYYSKGLTVVGFNVIEFQKKKSTTQRNSHRKAS